MTTSAPKPTNHVTRAIAENLRLIGKQGQMPEVPKALLEYLEKQYPPRCLQATETVEEHLRYAGMVDLVADMRFRFDQAPDWVGEDEPDPTGDDVEHVR